MRQVNNTLPSLSSSDDLTLDDFQLFPSSSTSSSTPTTASPLHSPLLPSTSRPHTDRSSSDWSSLLTTGSDWFTSCTSARPLLTCEVDQAAGQAESQRTPRLGWRLDTRPSAADAVLVVTVNNVPMPQVEAVSSSARAQVGETRDVAPPLSIDTDEADESVNALLSSLLSSGLSANRRFSYPPTSHTLASLPNQPHVTHATSTASTSSATSSASSSSTSCFGGPLRSLSPALMSPTAASSFFQTLDRKRAFKPYYRTPTFTGDSVHRVQLALTLCHPPAIGRRHATKPHYTAALYAVDPSNASIVLIGHERLSDDVGGGGGMWCWQVGVATCMVMCTLLRREDAADCSEGEPGERLWSAYFTVQQLLTDKALTVKGDEWAGREEVKVEVQSVHSLQLDDEYDRHILRQYEHESAMLREALHRADRRTLHSRLAHESTKKLVRATSAGEAGEVKY